MSNSNPSTTEGKKKISNNKYCQRECCGYFHIFVKNLPQGCPYYLIDTRILRRQLLLDSLLGKHGSEIRKLSREGLLNFYKNLN